MVLDLDVIVDEDDILTPRSFRPPVSSAAVGAYPNDDKDLDGKMSLFLEVLHQTRDIPSAIAIRAWDHDTDGGSRVAVRSDMNETWFVWVFAQGHFSLNAR
jgi:hypothetical protein